MSMEDLFEDLVEKIRVHGHAVVAAFADPEEGAPGFSYTIGLSKDGVLPELLIFGIDPQSSHVILNDMASRLKTVGRPEDGAKLERIANLPLLVRQVPGEVARHYARFVCSLLGNETPDVMQVVWPDPRGRFPGERGYDRFYDQAQPRLWESRIN